MSNVVRLVLIGVLAGTLGGCGRGADAGPGPFTEDIARKLLPEAASADPLVLNQLFQLGTMAAPGDVAEHPSLTAVALILCNAAWPPASMRDLVVAPKAQPPDVIEPWYGGDVPAKPDPARRPSLLHPKSITGVTVKQDGDKATGVVTFKNGWALSGSVHFEATRAADTWAITAFALPRRGARLERIASGWRLTMPPAESVPVVLPVVTTAGTPAPDHRITVTVRIDGRVYFAGQQFDLGHVDPQKADTAIQALSDAVGQFVERGGLDSDGTSPANFVLVADAGAKWKYAQWAMQVAAQHRVYRTHFAVQGKDVQEASVLKAFLPKDRGLREMDAIPPEVVKLKVFRRNHMEPASKQYTFVKVDNTHTFALPKGWPSDRSQVNAYREVLAKVRAIVAEKVKSMGDVRRWGEIVAPPPKGGSVPCEDVMNLLVILQEASVDHVMFEGKALPLTRHEREALRAK